MRGGATIKRHISVGIILSLIITRQEINKTYKNDEAFINDKDNILKIVGKDINLKLYDIETGEKYISVQLKQELITKYLKDLNIKFLKNPIYEFTNLNPENSSESIILKDPLNPENFNSIDRDKDSIAVPIKCQTQAVELFRTKRPVEIHSKSTALILIESYVAEFYHKNKLSQALIYGIE